MQEIRVQSLGQEDLLGEEMATHSSILARKIPWTEEPGRVPWGCKESDMTERLSDFTFTFFLHNTRNSAGQLVSFLSQIVTT